MKAEKDFVNTMVGLIFIVLIGVAFFLLFQEQIMAIANSVFELINKPSLVIFSIFTVPLFIHFNKIVPKKSSFLFTNP